MTNADKDTPLYRQRHSLAHVMAQAVLERRPGAQLGFGPPVDDGFYYDFLLEQPLSAEELPAIEERMRQILAEGRAFERRELPASDAIALLEDRGQRLKVEWAGELHETGEATLSFYSHGGFEDLCEGPHVTATSDIDPGAFKLDSIAGAYWRGNHTRPMLVRIYGLAFETPSALDEYVKRRELAMQRDHRKLGRELDLFMISEDVGPGLVFWLPAGNVIRQELERFAEEFEFRAGYQRVTTPVITKETLYRRSGHLEHYKDNMFPPMVLDDATYYLRPMNCPHHHLVYASRPRSYRELPLRLAEYGHVFRYELAGTLAGLLRVRAMCMNDAHIYCRQDQAEEELARVLDLYKLVYGKFRIEGYSMRLSLHDPSSKSEKYVEDHDLWLRAEEITRRVLQGSGIPYVEARGEAAFYGPKIDCQLKNVVGREETVSTNQLDLVMSERFGLHYVGEDGSQHRPVILHRAILSTHERFVAFLIEHLGGAFPTWLAPVQFQVVPVAPSFTEYAATVERALRNELFRAQADLSTERFNKKIRAATIRKVPNVLIVGERESQDSTVTWRRYCDQRSQRTLSIDELLAVARRLRAERTMDNFPDEPLPGA
jgi:threonyl-tRNA synthetase